MFMAALSLLIACSGDKKIKITERNFDEEIPLKTMLAFTFNQSMVPDTVVGVWSEIPYLKFEPEVEGKFHWQTASKLVFTPRTAFSPATSYTAKLTDDVFKYNRKKGFSGDKQFSFHTPFLEVISGRAYWHLAEEDGGEHVIRIDMEFNYPVLPSEVATLLSAELDGEAVNTKIITSEISENLSFSIGGLTKEDKDQELSITLQPGLIPHGGTGKMKEKFAEKYNILSPFKLEITDIQANHDGMEGVITVYTTQRVDEKNLKSFISLTPSIKYQVEVYPGYFTIQSENFSVDSRYDLVIKQGLLGTIGGKLKSEYSHPVSFGAVQPTIRFTEQKEFYVSGKGSRNIQAMIINVPKVKIRVTKLYENNILSYLRNNSHYYYDYEYYDYDYYYNYNDPGNLGDIIYESEVETNTLPRRGSNRVLTLDFEDKLADIPGIYVLEIKSEEDYWLRATRMIAISDIGLIVKKGEHNITVFANSIKSALPLPDVSVKLIGENNQVIHSGKTNSDGVFSWSWDELKASGFETSLVTAQIAGDFNVLPLSKTQVNTSRFDVGGKYTNKSGIEAFIYGDRNLYRPGETINISAILRDSEWKSPGSVPVILQLTTPNGRIFKTIRKTLNAFGSFETQIALPASSQTGTYLVTILTGNEVVIGSSAIKVEEFMPDRIKVDLKIDKKGYKPGEKILVDLQAVNFFGPPASGRNYEVELSIQQTNFYPKKNSDYTYYIHGKHGSFSNILRENKTDAEGRAHEEFDIPQEYRNMGVLRSTIFSTVFDETGRPVNRVEGLTIYTQEVFYGIKYDDYYVKTGAPVKFSLIAVDKEGNELSNIKAQVKLIRHEYKTVMTKSGSYFRYKSEKVENLLKDEQVTLNGLSGQYSFVPDLSGNYELRVSAPGVGTYVERDIYAYGWGSTRFSSFSVNNEGQIDIVADKEKYTVGETANFLLKTPFVGKILITVETDKVLDYFYVETDKRAASFTLNIKEEYLPNVYISATLFKPHGESDIPLTVAHGYAPVIVEDLANKMNISITAVEKSRSNTKQSIKVKALPNSALTLAVVDEGILQVAGYATPDPYAFYFQRKALGVRSSNIYPYLFPEISMTRSHTGGDGSEMAKRVNPMQNNRVKLVSFWSGILETNGKGEAEITVDIPQFSGDLRIMAIAYNGKIFGSAQENMKVADPLVISVALPRFLSPGDKLRVPVTLTNTTGKETRCKTEITLSGPLMKIAATAESISIPANTEARVTYEIEAKKEIGLSKVTITANALGEKFLNETDITVRPASPLQQRSGSGFGEAGKTISLKPNVDNFIASSIHGEVIITKNPMIQFASSLDYLVGYPYGCIEQTTSKAFPQIYFADLVGSIYKDDKIKGDAVHNVQEALDRLRAMQLYNGGLTYWPGAGNETWWGSAYAAHFTLEAKKAGYQVDDIFLKNVLRYLKMKLENKELVDYYYNGSLHKKIAPKEVPYSLYVLSLAGERPLALLNYYRSRTDQLSLDGMYMLAGAYALSGDMPKAKSVLPEAFKGEKSNTSFGGSFYSYIRDEAIALNVLLEIDPDNQQVGEMVKHISEALRNRNYLNTQERTFGFLAMGKFARLQAGTNPTGTVTANNKTMGSYEGNDLNFKLSDLTNKDIKLQVEGTGKLYYFWKSEGITSDGTYLEEDSYLQVRRTLYNRNGSKVNNYQFRQNDLVLVEIAIKGLTSTYVENVAITDILPACFEIENPRLTSLPPGMSFPNGRSSPEYTDIRDDRINLFTTVSNNTKYFYYLVRVVSAGTYQMGPVSADAMYNGEYHSYHGAAKIVVTSE
jgi:hypothetical protein